MEDIITKGFLLIIIFFLSVDSVFRLLDAMGLPIKFIEKKRLARNKDQIVAVLEEMGITESKSAYQKVNNFLQMKDQIPSINENEILDNLISKYTRVIGNKAVGLYETTVINYYIDFMHVSSDFKDLENLSIVMTKLITETMSSLKNKFGHFDKIAAPKGGNPILAIQTAYFLRKSCTLINLQSPLPEDKIDGQITPRDQVIIVHDVIVSGRRIRDCVTNIRSLGGIVNHAFVLVKRTDRKREEGSKLPETLLAEMDVEVHYLRELDDKALEAHLKK